MVAGFEDITESVNAEAAEYLGLRLGSYTLSPVLHFVKKSVTGPYQNWGGGSGGDGGRGGIVSTSQWRIGKELVVIFNPSSSINSERQSF